ncbi:FtsX-like permease family protein [Chitinophaga agrisoli]|uniref:FtsX-like permease family protein n=1 Tax=Chitinophaga agrisoli TaxID=2607653 RepID=A0A5B2VPE6_9BACT|nr:ABC transporter permease [Chitinophaga agrisoli]KAA2240276.1 FtsX-like permease family protein [Chitinophaga agrisoli]
MFKSNFKTMFRSLWKNKAYSFLNIFGLTIGITCAALIFLWVEDEMTFNRNFAKHDQLYHVMQNQQNEAGITTSPSTPGPLAAALKAEIPGIVNSGRLSWEMDQLVALGDQSIKEKGMYADPSILSMYSLQFVYGAPTTALKEPQSIVISETMSKKVFGDGNPVGKTVIMNARSAYTVDGPFTVTGVFKDLPSNCNYKFQWLSPYETWENANDWLKPWNNNLTETIVELSPQANAAAINKQLANYMGTKVSGSTNRCFLFSMNDWHLRNKFVSGVQQGGNIKYVRLFSTIAFIILLIACINFMNLATARSEQRAKEIGVLKVLGADKSGLIGKFISESSLISFIAVILAVGMLFILMPFYNALVQKQLAVNLLSPLHLLFLLAIGLITGLVAGSYPAFYLSSFNPVRVLKGIRIKSPGGVNFIRKGLVIAQFSASVILIISTMIVYLQVQHIRERNLGYSKDNLLYIQLQGSMKEHLSQIKNSLAATGYVENAATSLHDALHVYSYGDGFGWQGKRQGDKSAVYSNVVSPEYISTMHMKIVAGRDFYPGTADSNRVIINETMAGLMGAAGKPGSIITAGKSNLTVVGIIKDFVYNDVYGKGAPLILICGNYASTMMAVRLKPNVNLPEALAKTGAVMLSANPGFPFEYRFADADFDAVFATEMLIGRLSGVFGILAIAISCLGLFGLAAYTAERRTREIGVRRVLGASVIGLAGLLAREFLQLVVAACFIAFPAAWWLMHNWLQDYAYRTTIQWWVFLVAGVMALLIALITVSSQAIKAAVVNPVKSLKAE